jgi:hypothetical protein
VLFGRLARGDALDEQVQRLAAPGEARNRKYPALAVNARGEVLLAWTEGMGWNRGGELRWQIFGPDSRAIEGASGSAPGVPAWSLVAAAAIADGSFVLVY